MLHFNVEGLAAALGVFYYILVYGFGITATVLSIMSYQLPSKIAIILCNFFGQSCWVVHFVLQGDLTSAIACALSAVMLGVFSRSGKWKWAVSPVTIVFFIVILSGFSLLSFKSWVDIFPVLAGVFAVIANSRTTEKQLRIFAIFWCVFWLLNSILKMYPVAMVNDSLCTASAVISLVRYRSTNNSGKERKDEKI